MIETSFILERWHPAFRRFGPGRWVRHFKLDCEQTAQERCRKFNAAGSRRWRVVKRTKEILS